MAIPTKPSYPEQQGGLRRALSFFDLTNITVGAIVGADIYVASAVTASMLGPASLVAWATAGMLAAVLALTLADCARLVPRVGGPYAYVSEAYGSFAGFLAGWSMWIAEMSALPIFAIAFTNYLGHFVELDGTLSHVIRLAFLAVLTGVNVASVRAAGRFNDALTALKLTPLVLLVIVGFGYAALHRSDVIANLAPFAPYGFEEFFPALVLIVWAYMGFELTTVPATEVVAPERTIPRALVTGIAIVTVFYLTTNLVVYALVDHADLATTGTPLAEAGAIVFGAAGAGIMAVGAMVSVSGSDESDMLGSSRLAYAMAADGLLPHRIASVHPRFRTPYVALILQSLVAAALTFVDRIPDLISFAVVNLAFSFLLCALALFRLQRVAGVRGTRRLLPPTASLVALGLLAATSISDKAVGMAVLLVGVAVYVGAAPRVVLPHARERLQDRERALRRLARRRMRFLGGPIGWLGGRRTPR